MTARAILAEFSQRGIRLTAEGGQIIARPKGATPSDLREKVRLHKPELLQLLTWNSDAGAMLRAALIHVERSANGQPSSIHEHIADLLVEYGPIIAGLFAAQNLDALRCALLDFERNVSDCIAGRGYSHDRRICPACKAACPWCNTIGIIRCGGCQGLGRKR
jgi:hypothetical protein